MAKLKFRRDTASKWNSKNPTLAEGEMGLILDSTRKSIGFKFGDGKTPWNGLNVFGLGGSADLSEIMDSNGNVKYDLMPNEVTQIYTALTEGNKQVVAPTLIISYSVTDQNGNGVTKPTVNTDNNNSKDYLSVEIGTKVNYAVKFKWTSKDGYKDPERVTSDSSWKTFPDKDKESTPIEGSYDSAKGDFTDLIAKVAAPKTGVMVSGSTVVMASGDDTAKRIFDIVRTFRLYYGVTSSTTITESIIEGFKDNALVTSKGRTITGITTGKGEYLVIAYPVLLGALTSININGQNQLGGFTMTTVSVTNSLGLTQNYYVYRSNNDGVFSNSTIIIS